MGNHLFPSENMIVMILLCTIRQGNCESFSEGFVRIDEKPLLTHLKKSQSALIFFCSIPFILHKALDKSPPQPKMLSSENEVVGPAATKNGDHPYKLVPRGSSTQDG